MVSWFHGIHASDGLFGPQEADVRSLLPHYCHSEANRPCDLLVLLEGVCLFSGTQNGFGCVLRFPFKRGTNSKKDGPPISSRPPPPFLNFTPDLFRNYGCLLGCPRFANQSTAGGKESQPLNMDRLVNPGLLIACYQARERAFIGLTRPPSLLRVLGGGYVCRSHGPMKAPSAASDYAKWDQLPCSDSDGDDSGAHSGHWGMPHAWPLTGIRCPCPHDSSGSMRRLTLLASWKLMSSLAG